MKDVCTANLVYPREGGVILRGGVIWCYLTSAWNGCTFCLRTIETQSLAEVRRLRHGQLPREHPVVRAVHHRPAHLLPAQPLGRTSGPATGENTTRQKWSETWQHFDMSADRGLERLRAGLFSCSACVNTCDMAAEMGEWLKSCVGTLRCRLSSYSVCAGVRLYDGMLGMI